MKKNCIKKITTRIQNDETLELVSAEPILTKYMTLNTFCTCLKNDSLQFSKPRTWIKNYDVFEDLLSSVEYKKINNSNNIEFCSAEPLSQNSYAQCWNIGSECEGMWKSHTNGLDNGIMIKIKLENLIKLIVNSFCAEISSSDNIEFVKVKYVDKKNIINSANDYLVNVFDKGCRANNYIDFFKLKRNEFSYENEYRFLIEFKENIDNYKYVKGFIEYIEEIIFSPKFDDCLYEFYINKLTKDFNISESKISKSKMFDLDFHLKDTKLSKLQML